MLYIHIKEKKLTRMLAAVKNSAVNVVFPI